MSRRCYLCQRFIAKDSEHDECSACLKRMEPPEEYFDGFKFSDWITEQGWGCKLIDSVAGQNLGRLFRFWQEGRGIPQQKADEFLVALGLHFEDVPDDCRRPPPPRQNQEYPQGFIDQVVTLADAGMSPKDIARKLTPGPTVGTINGWLRSRGRRGRRVFQTVWDGIEKQGPDDCWLWQGSIRKASSRGERLHMPVWQKRRVQRIVLAEEFGITDSKTTLRMTCDNKSCCNPAHFEIRRQGAWQTYKIWGANHVGGQ